MKCTHRTLDVLQREFAKVAELRIYAIDHGIVGNSGYDDAARLSNTFEPARDIHAVAKNVVVFDNDVADIDPDTKLKTLIWRHGDIALSHSVLNVQSAASGVNDTCELDQEPITGGLDDTSPMFGNLEIKEFAPVGPQRCERAFLVGAHQPAISSDVGRKNRSKSAFDLLLRHFSLLGMPCA